MARSVRRQDKQFEGKSVYTSKGVDKTLVEDNSKAMIAQGIMEYLYNVRNARHRSIFSATTVKADVLQAIEDYLQTLEVLPVVYTRNQYINDLILLFKNGSAGAAPLISEALGFTNLDEDYSFNLIDYSNLEKTEPSIEPDPCQ